MAPAAPSPLTQRTDQEHATFSLRGELIYEPKLKPLLEPDHENEYVAIDVETEEYALGKSSGNAMRAMRQRRPEGRLVILTSVRNRNGGWPPVSSRTGNSFC